MSKKASEGSSVQIVKQKNYAMLFESTDNSCGWFKLDGLGFSKTSSRVISYGGLSLLFLLIGVCLAVGIDPIAAVDATIDHYGKTTVALFFIPALLLMLPLHELIHLAFHPDHGRTDASALGLQGGMVFVIYLKPMTKTQFVLMVLAPFFTLGFILATLLFTIPKATPLILILLFGHMAACLGDFYLIWQVFTRKEKFTKVWNRGTHMLAM